MRLAALIGGLLFAAILIRAFDTGDDQLLHRIHALEAETARLTSQVARLEQGNPPAPAETERPSGEAPKPAAPNWRLGPGLGGDPIAIVEQAFDQRSGCVEALLRIEAPLSDAGAWSGRTGQSVPIVLEARDLGGGIAFEGPMILLRGTRMEPGAYLHIGADLPPEVASRLGYLELRLEAQGAARSAAP
jgi:hypothetical protein